MNTVPIMIVSFIISISLTILTIGLARRLKIQDVPKEDSRHIHKKTTPLMGGLAILLTITIVTTLVLTRTPYLTSGDVSLNHYIGLFIAAAVLIIGGTLDDKFNLTPKQQLLFPALAAIIAISGGLGIEKMTNPFGGVIMLETYIWNILIFLWLMGMMYTTKLLDGLDGLATSIGGVGTLMVLLLAGTTAYSQPDIMLFSSIVLGAILGFLILNIHPAKIFLGEGGALLIGFILGTLAILSGGKIATLLLVMGIPILDVIWVMYRRIKSGKKITSGDRLHLHHRLFDIGLSQNIVVAIYATIALSFGILTLVLSSFAKLLALLGIIVVMGTGIYILVTEENKRPHKKAGQRD